MQRAQVLAAASAAVADRGLNYGNPEDNFARIARLWNAHLANRGLLRHSYGVNEADVALMMANVKQARLGNDETHADSWIDGAGYFACGAECAGKTPPPAGNAPTPAMLHLVGEIVGNDDQAFVRAE